MIIRYYPVIAYMCMCFGVEFSLPQFPPTENCVFGLNGESSIQVRVLTVKYLRKILEVKLVTES